MQPPMPPPPPPVCCPLLPLSGCPPPEPAALAPWSAAPMGLLKHKGQKKTPLVFTLHIHALDWPRSEEKSLVVVAQRGSHSAATRRAVPSPRRASTGGCTYVFEEQLSLPVTLYSVSPRVMPTWGCASLPLWRCLLPTGHRLPDHGRHALARLLMLRLSARGAPSLPCRMPLRFGRARLARSCQRSCAWRRCGPTPLASRRGPSWAAWR